MSGANIPSVSIAVGHTGRSTHVNELGMRPMQERVYQMRGEQFLLIKSPPASGKSRALMYIALDKLANQGVKQAVIVVPERSIGSRGSLCDRYLYVLRAADRLPVPEVVGSWVLVLLRQLSGGNPRGAGPGAQDDRAHSKRELQRQHA